MKQSHLRYPLTELLGQQGNVGVLRTLALHGGPLSVSQIARQAGLTPQGARGTLRVLAIAGVLTAHGDARSQVFELVEAHPMHAALLALFAAEQASWERFHAELRTRLLAHREVRSAWLYGSVARGEDDARSDVDIAVLVANGADAEPIREALRALGVLWSTTISVVALDDASLGDRADDDPWRQAIVMDGRVLKGGAPRAEFERARSQIAIT